MLRSLVGSEMCIRDRGLYRPKQKTSRWLFLQPDTAGGRPPGRPPTVIIMTVGDLRSTVEKHRAELSGPVDRPVDRPLCLANVHRSVHVGRPTLGPGRPAGRPPTVIFLTVGRSRSTAQKQRARLSGPVDRPVDRPMCLANVHRLVHVGRPSGRPTLGPGRSPEPVRQKSGSEKLVKKYSNKSHKSSKIPQK